MNLSIARNIRRLRLSAGLTQEQLAQKLFVTRQTVSLWELGKARPDVETLQAIADCLQVDLMEVLYGTERPPEKRRNRRLALWAGISAGGAALVWLLMEAIRWAAVQPQWTISPVILWAGNVYLWLGLYGCPLLALLSGAALNWVAFPPPEDRGRAAGWAVLGALSLAAVLGYLWGMTARDVPWVTGASWKLQGAPWLFLPMGAALGRGAAGLRRLGAG